MARILVVEDDLLFRQTLETLLEQYQHSIQGAESADEALAKVKAQTFDLLLTDVRIAGEVDGVEAMGKIRKLQPHIRSIIMTGYSDVDAPVRAAGLQADDYLLKPISADRLLQALERVQRALASEAAIIATPAIPRRLALPIGRRMQMVELDELDCALAQANYVELKVGARSFVLRETISGFHARLDPQRFLRIHRSAIVRIDAIREIEPLASGRYRVNLHSGQRLVSGRSYRDALRAALGLAPEPSISVYARG